MNKNIHIQIPKPPMIYCFYHLGLQTPWHPESWQGGKPQGFIQSPSTRSHTSLTFLIWSQLSGSLVSEEISHTSNVFSSHLVAFYHLSTRWFIIRWQTTTFHNTFGIFCECICNYSNVNFNWGVVHFKRNKNVLTKSWSNSLEQPLHHQT